MKQRYNEAYENDPTPSAEEVRRYRDAISDDEADVSLVLTHYRGGEEEFQLGCRYCASGDPLDRATGADVLGQLGWGDRTFLAESVRILIPLLEDADDYVVYCAGVALGHRRDPSAIPALLAKADHPDAQARFGVVLGLSGHEDERAIAALIRCAEDADRDVRNWAVFGLGSQIETDTPEIREALKNALREEDQEIRGEALVGLAERGDACVVPELLHEWRDDDVSLLSVEAAELAGDPRLHQRLCHFRTTLPLDDDAYFTKCLEQAIAACDPERTAR